jgi:hypothetical protein
MKKLQIAALAASIVFVSGTALGQDDAALPSFSPLETYTCNYNEGMGPDDLDAAVDAWNAFMDKEGDTDYFAATIVPIYFGAETFDFGWLGANSSGTAMGEGNDRWMSKGSEYAAKFAAVADCDTHSGFASTQIKTGDGGPAPDHFVITFSDCAIKDDNPDLFGAMNAWSAYASERGYKNSAWALFPVYGGGGAEFGFKLVNAYDNFSDLGTDWDLYASGDYVKHGELTDGAYECDDSRVYAGQTRRQSPSE